MIRGYNRDGMFFNEPIDYRISPDGSHILVFCAVIFLLFKIRAVN
ncbi:DUF6972 family protein [Nostoc sp.]